MTDAAGRQAAPPEDHVAPLRPRTISAYAAPVSCDGSGWYVSMAAGGSWLNSDGSGTASGVPIGGEPPYHVSVPGNPEATVTSERIEIDCPAEPGEQWLAISVSDSNFRPGLVQAEVWLEVIPAGGGG